MEPEAIQSQIDSAKKELKKVQGIINNKYPYRFTPANNEHAELEAKARKLERKIKSLKGDLHQAQYFARERARNQEPEEPTQKTPRKTKEKPQEAEILLKEKRKQEEKNQRRINANLTLRNQLLNGPKKPWYSREVLEAKITKTIRNPFRLIYVLGVFVLLSMFLGSVSLLVLSYIGLVLTVITVPILFIRQLRQKAFNAFDVWLSFFSWGFLYQLAGAYFLTTYETAGTELFWEGAKISAPLFLLAVLTAVFVSWLRQRKTIKP